jgi:hypothetical protein
MSWHFNRHRKTAAVIASVSLVTLMSILLRNFGFIRILLSCAAVLSFMGLVGGLAYLLFSNDERDDV